MNAEPNTTSDILSENEFCHAPAFPALPSSHHPSSHRTDRLTSAPEIRDPWATTLAVINQFFSAPDPMRNPPDLSGRSRLGGELLSSRKADGSDVRTYTVTVVEELSNALFALHWHDATLCNYEEQVWAPCLAPASGHCALSGEHISKGDQVYRPRIRGPFILNSDAVILASELIKASTRV
ncbi:DUF3331 domain-containing protein [Paraburkholderia sediminicola]|uniref:DUF3331 domain-containing protein n=1 Tax=Paraburkholderia sediminicola TaxID=458836 RepID=UPI0038BA5B02